MAKQRRELDGKVVAITGGARGIGKATANALLVKGCRVAIGDLDLALAQEAASPHAERMLAFELDVTDRASFAAFLDQVEEQLGPIEALVNNAGIMPVSTFAEEGEDSIRRQVDVNLHGVINGTQLAIERMAPRHRGHIVNIASQAGKAGVPGIATYSATKHAVIGLSEAVRGELRGSGVDVACVMPTVVNTELTSGVGQRWVKPVEAEDVAAAIVETLEVPRFDVFVPRINGVIYKILSLVPRDAREGLGRLMKVDRLMIDVDHGARRAYEERAAQATPRPESELEAAAQRDAA